MKKILLSIALVLFAAGSFAQTPKYVIYFIGDGMGINQAYLTQQYNRVTSPDGTGNLNFMQFPVRTFVSSYCANSLVTDSAAAGTALSSGEKTDSQRLGTRPDGSAMTSILEKAKRSGFGTGVVTSVGISHATPAAFYAHVDNRNSYDQINEQLIASKVDFAAGSTFLTERRSTMKEEDWVKKAKDAGIEVFIGQDEFKQVKGKRVIYLSNSLANHVLPFAIDRKPGDTTLSDFTEGAIDYLYSNFKKGFFLMVEGGEIDEFGHADDAAGCVAETNDMAKALDIALAFYEKHPKETVIIVTADHETGGLTMGAGQYALTPEVLSNQKVAKDNLTAELKALSNNGEEVTWSQVKAVLKKSLGFWDTVELTAAEENQLTQAYKEAYLDKTAREERNLYSSNVPLASVAVKILEKKANVTWGFGSHSGAPVPVFVKGASASSFMGISDNTDIPKTIEKIAKYK